MKDQKKKAMVKSQQVENERKRLKTDMNSPKGARNFNNNRGGFNRGNYGQQGSFNNNNKSGPYTFGTPNVYSNRREPQNDNSNKRRRF